MHRVVVIGVGKIGSLIACLLAQTNDYFVYLADIHESNPYAAVFSTFDNCSYIQLDAQDPRALSNFLRTHQVTAIISSLPYYRNAGIAEVAAECRLHYFDLTEDVATTQAVQTISRTVDQAFVPQCGLAPGFISIIANHIMQKFSQLDSVKLCVGALPLNVSNPLQYALNWSTEGLINEYGNPCRAINQGKIVSLQPLEGIEEIKLDGLTYEAFNTSGGVGSLVDTYFGKVQQLSYKTVRYPGHCAKIKFLMNELCLNSERDILKHILERVLAKTYQDVVLVYVSVTGVRTNELIEENFAKKFHPKYIQGQLWSAIQATTASSLCAIVDLVLASPEQYRGLVLQEQFSYDSFINNRFGSYYA